LGVDKMCLVHLLHLGTSRAVKVRINVEDRIKDRDMVKISVRAKVFVSEG